MLGDAESGLTTIAAGADPPRRRSPPYFLATALYAFAVLFALPRFMWAACGETGFTAPACLPEQDKVFWVGLAIAAFGYGCLVWSLPRLKLSSRHALPIVASLTYWCIAALMVVLISATLSGCWRDGALASCQLRPQASAPVLLLAGLGNVLLLRRLGRRSPRDTIAAIERPAPAVPTRWPVYVLATLLYAAAAPYAVTIPIYLLGECVDAEGYAACQFATPRIRALAFTLAPLCYAVLIWQLMRKGRSHLR